MNPPSGNRRPAPGLHGAGHLERKRVEAQLPRFRLELAFTREPPQIAVGADVVEAVIVDADVRQVRRHPLERVRAAELEKLAIAGRVELQQRRAELKALRPLRPAARSVHAVDGEHRRSVLRAPAVFNRTDLLRREIEQAVDRRQQIACRALAVDANHLGADHTFRI